MYNACTGKTVFDGEPAKSLGADEDATACTISRADGGRRQMYNASRAFIAAPPGNTIEKKAER